MILCGESLDFPKNAPKRQKKPTDILFLIGFVVAIVYSWSVTGMAASNDNFRPYITSGTDSFGNVCGQSSTTGANMHFMLDGVVTAGNGSTVKGSGFEITVPHFNIDRSSAKYELRTGLGKNALNKISGASRSSSSYNVPEDPRICVDACPGQNFPTSFFSNANIVKLAGLIKLSESFSNKGAFETAVDNLFGNATDANLIKDNLWCHDILTNQNYTDTDVLATCDDKKMLMPMSKMFTRCIPHQTLVVQLMESAVQNANATSTGLKSKFINSINQAATGAQDAVKAFSTELKYSVGVCIFISLVVILIVQIFTKYIVMIIVLGFFFTSLGAIYFVWASLLSMQDPANYNNLCTVGGFPICQPQAVNVTASPSDLQSQKRITLAVSFVCGIIVLTICCCWNNIRLAVQLFDEAGRCVFSMPFLLLQPIFMFITTVIAVWCFRSQFYYTLQVVVPYIDPAETGDTEINFRGPNDFWQYIWLFIFLVVVWVIYFVFGVHQVTLAGTISEWYWTKVSRRMAILPQGHAFLTCILCNLGSIALGSFLIALVNTIRIIIYLIERANKKATEQSQIMVYIMKCIQCCMWCVEKFLQFLNKNAYIGIAIFGYNFCRAARTSLSLKIENAGGALVVCAICSFVLFLAKVIAMGGSCVAFHFYCLDLQQTQYESLSRPQAVVLFLIVAIMAYTISSIFFSVYEMALDTIFLCFCEDQKRNKGTADSPYAASSRLQKFMSKNA